MERVGKPLTYSKIGRIIGVDAAKRYVGYFEETFLIYLVEKYGTPNVRKVAPKKCYSLDTGDKSGQCRKRKYWFTGGKIWCISSSKIEVMSIIIMMLIGKWISL